MFFLGLQNALFFSWQRGSYLVIFHSVVNLYAKDIILALNVKSFQLFLKLNYMLCNTTQAFYMSVKFRIKVTQRNCYSSILNFSLLVGFIWNQKCYKIVFLFMSLFFLYECPGSCQHSPGHSSGE